ncbi:chalcone isomerase family protein [Aliikangiella sp. G2MR2-5]|uniref:chalcone isomerase family protein n=1 Tax=Aliikangiella sp. G2MR2-5 TaxID=2788943 RepID=UPI0018ABAE2F
MKIVNILLVVTFLVLANFSFAEEATSEAELNEKLMAAQKIKLGDRPLLMVGMGLTRLMNDDYYIGAFYVDEAAQYDMGEDLAYLDASRRMEFRIASKSNISGRGFKRKLAEAIRINNAPTNVKGESEGLQQLFKLFKGTYKPGDKICFDYYKQGAITRVTYNGRTLGEVRRSKDLYQLLLKTWLGERPPSSKFKEGISGRNDTKYALDLLRRFVTL